jgi:ribonuclease HII
MQANRRVIRQAHIAGVDEAGRGPLAGPVVAAAVILDPKRPIKGLRDSKKLSPSRRDELACEIRERSLSWSVGWCETAEIDAINILEATMLAMRRAVLGLDRIPSEVRVDGNRLPDLRIPGGEIPAAAVIGGDATVPSISAASIVAKTTRDGMMLKLDAIYPEYGFARHKGYGTAAHRERLLAHGPCPEHRKSFAPVRALLP